MDPLFYRIEGATVEEKALGSTLSVVSDHPRHEHAPCRRMLRERPRVAEQDESTVPQHLQKLEIFGGVDEEGLLRDQLPDARCIELRRVVRTYRKTESLSAVKAKQSVRPRQALGPFRR